MQMWALSTTVWIITLLLVSAGHPAGHVALFTGHIALFTGHIALFTGHIALFTGHIAGHIVWPTY